MKLHTIIASLCALLFALVSCGRKTTSTTSVGPFNVDGDTGMATGQAFGIGFKAAGATGAEVTSNLSGSNQSSSRAEITLADDLKIALETAEEGDSVAFQLNGKKLGNLEKGDEVTIGEDRDVTVNGEKRTPAEGSPE